MSVLDTVVLFGAGDDNDKHHETSLTYLKRLESEGDCWVAGYAMFEFDVVMKCRGFSPEQRMEKHAALIKDFPALTTKTLAPSPSVLHLAAKLEREYGIDYFDAGVASESLQKGGNVVSPDRVFDDIPNLKRVWN